MKTLKITNWIKIPDDFTGIVEYPDGDKHWFLNGNRHRIDGPAIEYSNGDKSWYFNTGPKCKYSKGSLNWHLNNLPITEDEYIKKITPLKTPLGKLILNCEYNKLEE